MVLRQDLINILKFSLSIGDSNDTYLNNIKDEELETLLKLKASSLDLVYPNIPVSEEDVLLCLVKKEVYWKMATLSAPLYQLNLEGLSVSKQVRFDHYIKMVEEVDKEYKSLISSPNRVSVKSGDIVIKKPYTMNAYLDNYPLPTININIDKVDDDNNLYLSLNFYGLNKSDFLELKIYLNDNTIWDKYGDKITETSTLVITSRDKFKTAYKMSLGNYSIDRFNVLCALKLKTGHIVYEEKEVAQNVRPIR